MYVIYACMGLCITTTMITMTTTTTTMYYNPAKPFLYDNAIDFVRSAIAADITRYVSHNNNHVDDLVESYKLLRSNSTYFELRYGRNRYKRKNFYPEFY